MVGDKKILTVNAGSSSVKIELFDYSHGDERPLENLTVSITDIGLSSCKATLQGSAIRSISHDLKISSFEEAVDVLESLLLEQGTLSNIVAVGHRIVHGGPNYTKTTIVNKELIDFLQSNINLDPKHAPAEISLIKLFQGLLPDKPQFACFDTAYFAELPEIAQLLSIPKEYRSKGLRRYGFHGLSYSYLSSEFRNIAGEEAANGKVIYAHLGSGASLAATNNGHPIDTTMGFTPASGIIMSTRSGDIDPGIFSYINNQFNVSPEEYYRMVNFKSGLLGVSASSGDMYTLLQNESSSHDIANAIDLFVYQIKKTIGAFSAVLNGLDSLVFSGGIGEKSVLIRERVCDELDYLGINLDSQRNKNHDFLISGEYSRVGVHVIPARESLTIYNEVLNSLGKQGGEA